MSNETSIKANKAFEAFEKHLRPLIGGKITNIIVSETDDPNLPYHGFIVEVKKQKFQVVALCDPEGNGSGFLSITKRV